MTGAAIEALNAAGRQTRSLRKKPSNIYTKPRTQTAAFRSTRGKANRTSPPPRGWCRPYGQRANPEAGWEQQAANPSHISPRCNRPTVTSASRKEEESLGMWMTAYVSPRVRRPSAADPRCPRAVPPTRPRLVELSDTGCSKHRGIRTGRRVLSARQWRDRRRWGQRRRSVQPPTAPEQRPHARRREAAMAHDTPKHSRTPALSAKHPSRQPPPPVSTTPRTHQVGHKGTGGVALPAPVQAVAVRRAAARERQRDPARSANRCARTGRAGPAGAGGESDILAGDRGSAARSHYSLLPARSWSADARR